MPLTRENEPDSKTENEKEITKISSRNVLELIFAVYKLSFVYLAIFVVGIFILVWLINTIF